MKYIILILTVIILGFASYLTYITIQEGSYRKEYSEFYDIEEYILSLDVGDKLCDSLRYDEDGSENHYERIAGYEMEHEGFIYNGISVFTLEHELYNIRYGWHSTTEDKMFGRGQRKLELVFYLENKETLVESRNLMIYDFRTHTQTEELWYDHTNSSTVTEFDEGGKEIFQIILKDTMKRLDQCEN